MRSLGGLLARVFLSYATADALLAQPVMAWLRADGHEVFRDSDRYNGIQVGEDWRGRLYEQLRWADAVVCLVTSSYAASTWCFAEVAIAQVLGARLLPLAAEPGVEHPLLKGEQFADYHGDAEDAQRRTSSVLREIDGVGGTSWPDDKPPFPGLLAFQPDMHRVFFGRTTETGHLVRSLRGARESSERPLIVLTGPSGCGKSSLARAGVIPALAKDPRWAVLAPFIPGTDPVRALAIELADALREKGVPSRPAEIAHELGAGGNLADVADDLLSAGAGLVRRHLLIVVDQAEQLLNVSSPAKLDTFARLFHPDAAGPVQWLLTMRSEFIDRLVAHPQLQDVQVAPFPLKPLSPAKMSLIIQHPARLAGLSVDAELVETMVSDARSGEALPLLAYTLQRLALGVQRGGALSMERYEDLGGVAGALSHRADLALEAAAERSGWSREDVIASLLHLVVTDEHERTVKVDTDFAAQPDTIRRAWEPFIDERLLISHRQGEQVLVSIAHEALAMDWKPLKQAVEASGAALRMRHRVEEAAAEWDAAGRASEFLWEGTRVTEALTAVNLPADASPGERIRRRALSAWKAIRGLDRA